MRELHPPASFFNLTPTITDDGGCTNPYSLPPFKATGTLTNLTSCYCQVEHIHSVSRSVHWSVSLWCLPSGPCFVTFKEALPCWSSSCYQQLTLSLAFRSCCQASFSDHRMPSLLALVPCAVRRCCRLSRFPAKALGINTPSIYLKQKRKPCQRVTPGFGIFVIGVRSGNRDRPFVFCKRLNFSCFSLKTRRVTPWRGIAYIFKIRV